MKGSTEVKHLNSVKKVYKNKIVGEPGFPNHYFVIEPLNGNNGEKFFYVKEVEGGVEVMGEGYICQPTDAASHAKSVNDEVEKVVFLATDERGSVLRGDEQEAALRKLLGKAFRPDLMYVS